MPYQCHINSIDALAVCAKTETIFINVVCIIYRKSQCTMHIAHIVQKTFNSVYFNEIYTYTKLHGLYVFWLWTTV